MSQKESNNIHYSAQDIARYHQGLMSLAERNALERAALEDPFLEEAMEGYKTKDHTAPESALRHMRQRLESRVSPERNRSVRGYVWWAAASLVLLVSAGLFWYTEAGKSKKALVAEEVKAPASATSPTPERATPERATPEQVTPERATAPTPATPERATPEQATPERATPEQATPERATPALATAPPSETKPKNPTPAATQPTIKPSTLLDSNEITQADLRNNAVTNRLPRSNNGPTGNAAFSNNNQALIANRNINRKVFQANTPPTGETNPPSPAPAAYQNLFRLTDTGRKPIQYASVQILPHGYTTTTDAQGYFSLPDQDTSAQVAFTALGYQEKSILINEVSKAQTITLLPKTSSLDEVVVTGYGTPKKYAEYAKKASGPYHTYADSVGVQPMDGWENYSNYLVTNMQVPMGVKNYHIHGEVALSFEVDQHGHPYNISVEHSLCMSCDAEAIRLVKAGPTWKISGKTKKKKRGWIRIHF
jgi:outer membrane biosynthesis protein TonB